MIRVHYCTQYLDTCGYFEYYSMLLHLVVPGASSSPMEADGNHTFHPSPIVQTAPVWSIRKGASERVSIPAETEGDYRHIKNE